MPLKHLSAIALLLVAGGISAQAQDQDATPAEVVTELPGLYEQARTIDDDYDLTVAEERAKCKEEYKSAHKHALDLRETASSFSNLEARINLSLAANQAAKCTECQQDSNACEEFKSTLDRVEGEFEG